MKTNSKLQSYLKVLVRPFKRPGNTIVKRFVAMMTRVVTVNVLGQSIQFVNFYRGTTSIWGKTQKTTRKRRMYFNKGF